LPIRQRSARALGALLGGALVVTLGACGDDSGPDRDESTNEISEAGDADVFEIAVGDCLPDPNAATGEVQEVPVVPCDEPHASEVYFSHIIEGDELPDATAMEAIVNEQCMGNFESFIGLPFDQSALQVTWLQPTDGSWDAGDRELLCIVSDPAGGVTGSLSGAAR
jgi:hypothetical protein